jgi:hypothetical protein
VGIVASVQYRVTASDGSIFARVCRAVPGPAKPGVVFDAGTGTRNAGTCLAFDPYYPAAPCAMHCPPY